MMKELVGSGASVGTSMFAFPDYVPSPGPRNPEQDPPLLTLHRLGSGIGCDLSRGHVSHLFGFAREVVEEQQEP